MAKRDRNQGFAFVLPHMVVNFNKDVHKVSTLETGNFDNLYDVLENALDLLDNSDFTVDEIISALMADLEKFRGK